MLQYVEECVCVWGGGVLSSGKEHCFRKGDNNKLMTESTEAYFHIDMSNVLPSCVCS